ncbi:hypothetical protein F5887DRAFT_1073863 [Amanita rubescens]|nr:hypothetical protein F5887DRAFT_1073863 [Amanita rubescens]
MLLKIYLALAVAPVAIAQSAVTEANCTDSQFNWVFNSMGQSPCYVASILTYPCGNPLNILPLPSGSVYRVEKGHNNTCTCNSVFYSLTSACSACRDGGWNTWSSFATNCSSTYFMEYTESIPSYTNVPQWAYLNVTATNNTFDVAVAESIPGVSRWNQKVEFDGSGDTSVDILSVDIVNVDVTINNVDTNQISFVKRQGPYDHRHYHRKFRRNGNSQLSLRWTC